MKNRIFEIFTYLIFGAIVFVTTQKFFPKTVLFTIERVDNVNESVISKSNPIGAKKGLNLVYIFSYDCRYCFEMNEVIEQIFMKYKNQVSFHFLNNAKLNDQVIFEASIFSECILKFDTKNYFNVNNYLYEKILNNKMSDFDYYFSSNYGNKEEVYKKISNCVDLQETFSSVHTNQNLVDLYAISETPAIIVDDKLIKGSVSYNILDSIIENYLTP